MPYNVSREGIAVKEFPGLRRGRTSMHVESLWKHRTNFLDLEDGASNSRRARRAFLVVRWLLWWNMRCTYDTKVSGTLCLWAETEIIVVVLNLNFLKCSRDCNNLLRHLDLKWSIWKFFWFVFLFFFKYTFFLGVPASRTYWWSILVVCVDPIESHLSDTVTSMVAENFFLLYNMLSNLYGFPRLTCKYCFMFKREARVWHKVD